MASYVYKVKQFISNPSLVYSAYLFSLIAMNHLCQFGTSLKTCIHKLPLKSFIHRQKVLFVHLLNSYHEHNECAKVKINSY